MGRAAQVTTPIARRAQTCAATVRALGQVATKPSRDGRAVSRGAFDESPGERCQAPRSRLRRWVGRHRTGMAQGACAVNYRRERARDATTTIPKVAVLAPTRRLPGPGRTTALTTSAVGRRWCRRQSWNCTVDLDVIRQPADNDRVRIVLECPGMRNTASDRSSTRQHGSPALPRHPTVHSGSIRNVGRAGESARTRGGNARSAHLSTGTGRWFHHKGNTVRGEFMVLTNGC